MATEKPEFLVQFLNQTNPSLDPQLNIPHYAFVSTLKKLLAKFTELLFTKLNYVHIFRSHYSIPPYTAIECCRVSINFACLYLFFYDKYETIHYQKFVEKLNIKPLWCILQYNISHDTPQKPLFEIYNNNCFTITVNLNIPKNNFLGTFNIPSLKPYVHKFNEWFETFFKSYQKQFTNIN